MKIYEYDVGHMIKVADMSMYNKNPLNVFFSIISGPISTKHGMKHL